MLICRRVMYRSGCLNRRSLCLDRRPKRLIVSFGPSAAQRARGCHTSILRVQAVDRSFIFWRMIDAGSISAQRRRVLLGVVRHAGSVTRIAFIIVLSSRDMCQPTPVPISLSFSEIIRVRPGHHASAPYRAVLRMHVCTARIRGPGAASR